ncbi:MAG: DNRLRE domain-containing protein [candidate division WOR-3 bacterium]
MREWILFICALFIACNKLPLGEEELNERGYFEAITINLPYYVSFTESKAIPLGTSQNLIIGKDNKYESRIILKFNFSDTTYQGLDQIKLILFKNKNFHNDTLKFSVHVLTNEFSETEATWYKKDNTDLWTNPGGDFEVDSLRWGEIKGDSCVVYFNYIDLGRIKNGKGIILIPENTGFCAFYARESGKLSRFQLVKNGVISSIPLQADCHILKIDTFPNYWEDWLGSGVSFRNYAKFSYDTILNGTKAIYGELTFRSIGYYGMRDSIEIGVKYLKKPFIGFDTELGPQIALKKFALSDTLFALDIVQYVQRIIEHPDSNFGMFIYLSPEDYDIANIKLVTGSHRLKVGYIKPPEER